MVPADLTERREGAPPLSAPGKLEIGPKLVVDLLALGIVVADLFVVVPWYWYAGLFVLSLAVAMLLQVFVVLSIIDGEREAGSFRRTPNIRPGAIRTTSGETNLPPYTAERQADPLGQVRERRDGRQKRRRTHQDVAGEPGKCRVSEHRSSIRRQEPFANHRPDCSGTFQQ
jgi:hypothetical protein